MSFSIHTIETGLLDGLAAVAILFNCTRFEVHFQEWRDELKQTIRTYHIAADVRTYVRTYITHAQVA